MERKRKPMVVCGFVCLFVCVCVVSVYPYCVITKMIALLSPGSGGVSLCLAVPLFSGMFSIIYLITVGSTFSNVRFV